MKFNNLKIGIRIGLGFLTVLTLLALVIALGLSRLTAINDTVHAITSDRSVSYTHLTLPTTPYV